MVTCSPVCRPWAAPDSGAPAALADRCSKVLDRPPIVTEPGEGPLDSPAAWMDGEAKLPGDLSHDLDVD